MQRLIRTPVILAVLCVMLGMWAGGAFSETSATAPAGSAASLPAPASAPTATADVGEWSKPSAKLRGRLVLAQQESKKDILVSVEVQAVTSDEVSLGTHPQMQWLLTDGAGKEVAVGTNIFGSGGSGGIFMERWVSVLPGNITVTLGLRPPGAFAAPEGMRILAVQNKEWKIPIDASVWALPPGQYVLTATMTYEKKAKGPENQWVGTIELPGIKFKVSGK